MDVGEPINGKAAPSQQNTLPNAPSSNTTAPSLRIGPDSAAASRSAQDQARLDKRTHMLKIHQRPGLITIACWSPHSLSPQMRRKNTTTLIARCIWVWAGVGRLIFYYRYYAIRAPRIPGTETRGPIRLHKAMAWIDGRE